MIIKELFLTYSVLSIWSTAIVYSAAAPTAFYQQQIYILNINDHLFIYQIKYILRALELAVLSSVTATSVFGSLS